MVLGFFLDQVAPQWPSVFAIAFSPDCFLTSPSARQSINTVRKTRCFLGNTRTVTPTHTHTHTHKGRSRVAQNGWHVCCCFFLACGKRESCLFNEYVMTAAWKGKFMCARMCVCVRWRQTRRMSSDSPQRGGHSLHSQNKSVKWRQRGRKKTTYSSGDPAGSWCSKTQR